MKSFPASVTFGRCFLHLFKTTCAIKKYSAEKKIDETNTIMRNIFHLGEVVPENDICQNFWDQALVFFDNPSLCAFPLKFLNPFFFFFNFWSLL